MPSNKHNLIPCLPALLAVLFTATLLSACSAGSAPASESEVRAQIETALGILATGLEREDPLLASQPIDEQFLMGGNVSIRYSDTAWDPNARGISAFRGFFNASFLLLQNISQEFTLTAINVNGAVATCQVTGNFSGVRVDAVPPQNVNASGIDYMTFQRKGGQWLLIRWDEVPPETPPVDTGGGGV